jgi:hypothetical protein
MLHRLTLRPFAVLGLTALLAGQAAADGPVLVTLTGTIENTNRGPMDPDWDKLFLFNNVAFEAAHAFTADDLAALPQTTVRTDFPMGGEVQEFTGVSFADLLEAAGATGETVFIQALDGYAAEAAAAELAEKGAILAIERNGTPLDIGGLGPAMVAYPRAERDDLAEMNDDGWVWQVFHVRVE